MTVDSSPVKFTAALPGQPEPEILTISGGRPVFRAELPDGRIVWLVSGYEKRPPDARRPALLPGAGGCARSGSARLRDVRHRLD